MKKIFMIIIFIIAVMLFNNSIVKAKETTCSKITNSSECASSTQDGGACEWDGEHKVCRRTYPDVLNCSGFTTEASCMNGKTKENGNFGCNWNKQYKFCSASGLAYLSCGSGDEIAYDIPVLLPNIISYFIVGLKIATPVILIFMSMIQLIKAIGSQNEDEMKKAQGSIIKKLIAAALVFFVISIVQFIVKQVADDSEQSSLQACMSCFINNDCDGAMYFTDGYGNCFSVKDGSQLDKCPVERY